MKKIFAIFFLVSSVGFMRGQISLPPISATTTSINLDSLGRVVGISDSFSFQIAITYDAVGNIISQSKTVISATLPVDLLYFEAIEKDEDVLCKWTTANEIDMDYYSVEWSEDGVNYGAIGRKEAVGNSSGRERYTFQHLDPVIGANYYRLKMFGVDGSWEYSNIELVNFSDFSLYFEVFPNPTDGIINIEIKENTDANVTIIDVVGQVVFQTQMTTERLGVDLSKYAAGIYYVNVEIGNRTKAKKILKR